MKITAMHIYQYGKFSDRSFQLSDSSVQVIYGLNEAGKTTLMSFIKSVLFGFPKSKKYEPKNGGVYGGTVELKHVDHGAVKIERTKGNTPKKSECIWLQAKSRTENGSNSFSPIQTGRCTKRSIRSMYSDCRRFKLLTGTKSASFSCIRAYSGRKRRQSLTGGWQKNLTGCISRTGGTPA